MVKFQDDILQNIRDLRDKYESVCDNEAMAELMYDEAESAWQGLDLPGSCDAFLAEHFPEYF